MITRQVRASICLFAAIFAGLIANGALAASYSQPTVSSFSPRSVAKGSVVTVTGTGFTGIDKAWIGSGQDAQTKVMSDTRLLITVPADATSGNIAVLNPQHSAFSSGSLTVSATASYAQPSVTSFSPNNGPAGTVITVKGKGFTGLDAA